VTVYMLHAAVLPFAIHDYVKKGRFKLYKV